MFGNLFVKAGSHVELKSFANWLFSVLGVKNVERRGSSNYLDEVYYLGTAMALQIVVARADEPEFPESDFWITFDCDSRLCVDSMALEYVADIAARKLVEQGLSVYRALEFGKPNGVKLRYTLERNNGHERVVTEQIRNVTA